MTRLSSHQLHALNRVLLSLHEDVIDPQPLESIIDLCQTLLPVSWISVDEADLRSGHVVHRGGRHLESIPQIEEKMKLYGHENPLIAFAQEGRFAPAVRISDFASFREIRRTNFYQEMAIFVPGWRDQAALPIRLPGKSLGFALNCDRVFSDEELLMLELLQPHVERVLRRSLEYLALTVEKPLTPREREVLHWMAEGKRDEEIAVILGISVRTAEQHVHVCLRKLGVETRSGAVAAVWRLRSSGDALINPSEGSHGTRGGR